MSLVNFYLVHLVFIFRDFSRRSLLFGKLFGKLQVKLQFVSDYNNVWIFIGRFSCLFFINFINSWFHSWTIRSFSFVFWISITLSIFSLLQYRIFHSYILNFIINFDFIPFHWFLMLTLSYLYGKLQIKLQIADYNLCQVRNNM